MNGHGNDWSISDSSCRPPSNRRRRPWPTTRRPRLRGGRRSSRPRISEGNEAPPATLGQFSQSSDTEHATMRIHNLYADETGETHFRDIEIEFTETGPDGTISKMFPAIGVIF